MVKPPLAESERGLLIAELEKRSAAFDLNSLITGEATTLQYYIDTGDALARNSRTYRVSPSERGII